MSREHLSVYARTVVPDAAARDPHDFYPTPPGATMALCSVEQFPGTVWEPACGEGDMARVLVRASGARHVYATDLIARGGMTAGYVCDFLATGRECVDHVVTNPPFKLAQRFVEHGLCQVPEGGRVAVLVRLMFLESLARRAWFAASGLARVWVFADRVPFQRGRLVAAGEGGGRMVPYAWFVFVRGHSAPPTLGWISYAEGCAAWRKEMPGTAKQRGG